MRISEKQFSKICQHLGISVSTGIDREFTPREIDRLQHFVIRKRAESSQKKSKPQTAMTTEVASIPVAPGAPEPALPQANVVVKAPAVEAAGTGIRVVAYIIDCLLTMILAPLILVPILGQMLIGILLFFYWLLRDVGGASPGKLILGLQVVNDSGDPFRVGPRILRNALLSIGPLLFCIPVIGIFIGAPIAILMVLVEAGMLLITGNRIGDMLGGTSVKLVPKVRLAAE
tara:strand:+ start:12474 stop:13163 length:690 start_codon:yes stop_codon:yes gene_type:complete